jgi:hypothetical protein
MGGPLSCEIFLSNNPATHTGAALELLVLF